MAKGRVSGIVIANVLCGCQGRMLVMPQAVWLKWCALAAEKRASAQAKPSCKWRNVLELSL